VTQRTQQAPYIREQRNFPGNTIQELTTEIDRAYIDIAQKINVRTIGLFAVNTQVVTGEKWYLAGQPKEQQTLRKLFAFTSAGSISHGIVLTQITGITKIYGTYTDGTNWYPLPFVNTTNVTDQVSVIVNSNNIVITAGSGAPAISRGYVILEWLSQV